jgi:hypothetical protein
MQGVYKNGNPNLACYRALYIILRLSVYIFMQINISLLAVECYLSCITAINNSKIRSDLKSLKKDGATHV